MVKRMVPGEQQITLAGRTYTFRRVHVAGQRYVWGTWDVAKERWFDGPHKMRRTAIERFRALCVTVNAQPPPSRAMTAQSRLFAEGDGDE